MSTFGEVLEAVDSMSLEERAELVRIIEARMREERRTGLVREVQESRKEYADGKCQSGSVAELMAEILK